MPPTLVTASATRCSSAAPATVRVCPSRNGEPAGTGPAGAAPGRPAAARAPFELRQQIGGCRDRLAAVENVGDADQASTSSTTTTAT